MEQVYLKHAPHYRSLVAAAEPTLKPRILTRNGSPSMVVSARIRPFAKDEVFPLAVHARLMQRTVLDVYDLHNHFSSTPTLKPSNYELDQVFGVETTTEEVYKNLVADLVSFARDGGIATLFAYGQTGSGKTFTISSLQQLIAGTLMGGNHKAGKEVYMTIIDLAGKSSFDLLNGRAPVRILDDATGTAQVVGAAERRVNRLDEMEHFVEQAASHRRTDSTLKNDASSRSHAICRIRIRDSVKESDGLLYMVDLAGSESARDVVQHGKDRMRETIEINASLSTLSNCICERAKADGILLSVGNQKLPRIPTRESLLTRLLKHVFDPTESRACKTVVIACVNPSLADVGSTRNTLRYAEMLRNPVPRVDVDPTNPLNWSNVRLQEWITDNASRPNTQGVQVLTTRQSTTPPIFSHVFAPRETGIELLRLSDLEFDCRCQTCPGVRSAQAKAFRLKFWRACFAVQQ